MRGTTDQKLVKVIVLSLDATVLPLVLPLPFPLPSSLLLLLR
ncbi:hypothetical protein Tco_1426846, partial [Tanacetum coccineum]